MAAGGEPPGAGSICGYTLDPDDPTTWPAGVVVDPETVSAEELPTCQRNSLDGHDRCGLHLPMDDRPDDFDASAAVADHLDAVSDPSQMTAGPGGTASLVGIRLAALDLTAHASYFDSSRLTTLDLRFVRIEGTLSMSEQTYSQQVRLDGASIGRLHASNTTFERDVSLTRSQIGGEGPAIPVSEDGPVVNLSNATVNGRLSLQAARIEGNVSLSDIKPLARLVATDATVEGLLLLDGTTIGDQTMLKGVRCEQLSANHANLHRVEMTDLTVQSATKLRHTDLWGVADDDTVKVGDATFAGRVLLTGATFHSPVNLQHVSIDDKLDLEDAEFRGTAKLQGATFRGPIEATAVSFQAELHCPETHFDKHVGFERAIFEGEVRFDDAVFTDHVRFDRAEFHARAVFDDAEFMADCFFRAVSDATRAAPDRAPTETESRAATDARAQTTTDQDTEGSTAEEREPVSDSGQTTESDHVYGVFRGQASFKRTIVRGQADFRVLATDPDSDELFSPESEIDQNAITVAGTFKAPEATLTDADLAGFSADDMIELRGADLAEANLRNADLRAADAEQAKLSHANLFGADLRDCRLHGAVFEGSRVDDHTDFGEKVIYHTQAQQATDQATELERLEQAISLYSQLETLARDNGQPAMGRTMFVNRKHAQRRRIRLAKMDRTVAGRKVAGTSIRGKALNEFDYGFATLKWLVMNYGESYWRVVITSAAIVVGMGLLFPIFELGHTTTENIAYGGPLGEWLRAALFGILYSLSAFTALGIGQFTPGSIAETLAVAEAGIGILMFGLLLFVLQRRTAR